MITTYEKESIRKGKEERKREDRGRLALAVITFLLAVGTAHAAQETTPEPGPTTPADDLPAEFKLLLGTDSEQRLPMDACRQERKGS